MKLILIGPPGSGKGTVAEKLSKDFGWYHLSMGALLREEVSKGTTLGKEIESYIEKGNLVPDELAVEMAKVVVKDKDDFVLDGFPRTLRQAEDLADVAVDKMLFLQVPEEIVIERFSGRRMCPKGHGYHVKYIPPKIYGKCDVDGLELVQRKDDDPKVVRDRFKIYHKETEPLIKYYQGKGLLLTVDAAPAPNKVYEEVKKVLEEFLK